MLAIGSQHVDAFAGRADVHFAVRMVDRPAEPLALPDHELLIGRPGDIVKEKALLQRFGVTHIVCRNSGGDASYAKIAAARELGVRVVMISRPRI